MAEATYLYRHHHDSVAQIITSTPRRKGTTMATNLTQENFAAEVKESSQSVIIDCYADWCGPCQQMTPIFEELEGELGSTYKFAKINIDNARELATELGVTSVPTFIFLKNGEVVGKESGYMSKDVLKEKIESHLG